MSTETRSRAAASTRLWEWSARVSESVESRLWPLPTVAIVATVLLGIVVPRVDLLVDSSLPAGVDSLVFNGGAETARSVLSSIAGSLITATSLTFSLTVVALQLASSQASPRVLRLFVRDRRVHATLAVFLGTFAYSITVLRSVKDDTESAEEFVPRIAVTVGFALTLASVLMLVFFLAHLATQLRVETILKEIHNDTDRTISLVGAGHATSIPYLLPVDEPQRTQVALSTSSGFITSRDHQVLIAASMDHGVVIRECWAVGENVLADTPLAEWWVRDRGGVEPDAEAIAREVRRAYSIGYERTAAQDVEYGLQQVIDIGVRALSPGVNDPTTAVNALGHLSAIVAGALRMPDLPAVLADSSGQAAVITKTWSPADTVRRALTPLRHYGAGDPTLTIRFLQVITDLAFVCPAEGVRNALRDQLGALKQQLEANRSDPVTSAELIAAVEAALRASQSWGDEDQTHLTAP